MDKEVRYHHRADAPFDKEFERFWSMVVICNKLTFSKLKRFIEVRMQGEYYRGIGVGRKMSEKSEKRILKMLKGKIY